MNELLVWLTPSMFVGIIMGMVIGALVYDMVFDMIDDRYSTRWFSRRNFWLRLAAYGITILVIVLALRSIAEAAVALFGLGLVWLAFWLRSRNGTVGRGGARVYTGQTPMTGSIKFHIDDLPWLKRATVNVVGPNGYQEEKKVWDGSVLRDLVPGEYTLIPEPVRNGRGDLRPDADVYNVTVVAGRKTPVTIAYSH